MDQIKVPEKLYRGIKVNYKMFTNGFKVHGVDLKPYYEPVVDKNGREVVHDGNEYGLYMSDNVDLPNNTYARVEDLPSPTNCIRQDLTLKVSGADTFIAMPDIGVVYEIDSKGISVRRPWMNGFYSPNGGYIGDEWIADVVPKNNYKVKTLIIGKDLLHDALPVDTSNIEETEKTVANVMDVRKTHFEDLSKELEKLTPEQRRNFTTDQIKICRHIFGDDGVKYCDYSKKELKTAQDCYKFLFGEVFKNNHNEIDFKRLGYLQQTCQGLTRDDDPAALIKKLQQEMIKNNASLQNAQVNGNTKAVQTFSDKNKFLGELLDTVKQKQRFQDETNNKEKKVEIKRADNGIIVNGELRGSKKIEQYNEELKQKNKEMLDAVEFAGELKAKLYELNNKVRGAKAGSTILDENGIQLTLEELENDQATVLCEMAMSDSFRAGLKKEIDQIKAKLEAEYKELERQATEVKEDESKADDAKSEPAKRDLEIKEKTAEVKSAEDEKWERQGYVKDEYDVWVKQENDEIKTNSKKQQFTRSM